MIDLTIQFGGYYVELYDGGKLALVNGIFQ